MPTTHKRSLSITQLITLNVLAVISLRNLPGNALLGWGLIPAYLVAGLCFLLPSGWLAAQLSYRYPTTGGTYLWVTDSFGPRWGLVNIWLQWLYNMFWYPTIFAFMATNILWLIHPALSHQPGVLTPCVIALLLITTLMATRGIYMTSRLGMFCAVVGTLLPALIIILIGVVWWVTQQPMALALPQHTTDWV